MLLDYTETQEEMDKLAFTLDRNNFSRASSFAVGHSTETAEIKPQVRIMDSVHSTSLKICLSNLAPFGVIEGSLGVIILHSILCIHIPSPGFWIPLSGFENLYFRGVPDKTR